MVLSDEQVRKDDGGRQAGSGSSGYTCTKYDETQSTSNCSHRINGTEVEKQED